MSKDPSDTADQLSSRRKYAAFFEWFNKAGKELGVAEELVNAVNLDGSLKLSGLAICDRDPPDLTCQNENAGAVAIEVSEIVCEDAVRLNQQGKDVYREWRPGELSTVIAERLARKDQVDLYGGPYDEFLVCLFTDEMMITPQGASLELSEVTFGPYTQINKAYLLFSYQPNTKNYPVIRLNIDN